MGERAKTYQQKMQDLRAHGDSWPMIRMLFRVILSGSGINRIDERLILDGEECLQITFSVYIHQSQVSFLKSPGAFSKVKDSLEVIFRSDEIGKSYPGIYGLKYDFNNVDVIRMTILFKGTPIPGDEHLLDSSSSSSSSVTTATAALEREERRIKALAEEYDIPEHELVGFLKTDKEYLCEYHDMASGSSKYAYTDTWCKTWTCFTRDTFVRKVL